MKSYYQRRRKAFGHALTGLMRFFREEAHARLHGLATVMAVALGFLLEISRLEWLSIILAIGLVIATEAVNSALEQICNLISTEHHPAIGRIKDLAAGAVLLAALAAFIIGMIIFLPPILALF